MTRTTLAAAAALAAFALASCGGGGGAPAAAPSQPQEQPTPPTTPSPTDPGTIAVRDPDTGQPVSWTPIEHRELEHGGYGLFRIGNGDAFPSIYIHSNPIGRPAASGTWRGRAFGHNCGRSGCDPFEPYEQYRATASITYSGATGEVVVDLTDWRDADGTRLQEFRSRSGSGYNFGLEGDPITLEYNAANNDFRGRRLSPSNAAVLVSFHGGSGGRPSEAMGTWKESFFQAAFGGTRQ